MARAVLKKQEKDYRVYGVSQEDEKTITQVQAAQNPYSLEHVSQFGQDGEGYALHRMGMIAPELKNGDLGVVGEKMTQALLLVQNQKPAPMLVRKIPVVERGWRWVARKRVTALSSGESAEKQVLHLVQEVENILKSLSQRNALLETAFEQITEEIHRLGILIVAAKRIAETIEDDIRRLETIPEPTPMEIQELADAKAALNRWNIRAGNLVAVQESAIQTLPQIRIVQSSNVTVMEKFSTFKTVVLPAWRRQLLLRESLVEQESAQKVADAIDEAVNRLLTDNAQLLHRNAVRAAEAQQRLSISPETLEAVQRELLATVRDVIDANARGQVERERMEQRILTMRKEFRGQLRMATQTLEGPETQKVSSANELSAFLSPGKM